MSSLTPNKDFRADPKRGVYVQGRIDQQLIDRLTPEIIRLQAESRDPITVYIDSPGGSISHGEVLLRLLTAEDQGFSDPCRLITVVTSVAASAAADLLSSGGYAIAYPGSVIFFHGVRSLTDNPLTVESASSLRDSLRLSNDRYAMALADRSYWRLVFRYATLRSQFEAHRAKQTPKDLSDLDCFVELISEKLSKKALKLIQQAQERNAKYENLVDRVLASAGRRKGFKAAKRVAEFEAALLHGVIDVELRTNTGQDWKFTERGIAQLSDDFFLLDEYLNNYETPQMLAQCRRWADYFLTDGNRKELEAIPEGSAREERKIEIVKPIIRPIWLFFVALCHALQAGEYELTPLDAFWLGLIDEVVGRKEEVTLRLIVEATVAASTVAAAPAA